MTFLIDIQELKDLTPIEQNVDEILFNQTVLYVQDIYIQNICGTALYNELLTQVAANTLTALNTTLVNTYLQPAMRFYIMAEIVRPLAIRFTNVGIMQNNTTHSNSVDSKTLVETEAHYRNRAEVLATRASSYLCANESSYPLFTNPGSAGNTIHPKDNQYTSPISFGNEKKNRFH